MTISASGNLSVHDWAVDFSVKPGSSSFLFDLDPIPSPSRRYLDAGLQPKKNLTSRSVCSSYGNDYLFMAGCWDNSLRLVSLTRRQNLMNMYGHRDTVTCVHLDSKGNLLITGGYDGTCLIWRVDNRQNRTTSTDVPVTSRVKVKGPIQAFYNHREPVTCVRIVEELNMAVSASADGSCVVSQAQQGTFLRRLIPIYPSDGSDSAIDPGADPSFKASVDFVDIGLTGHVVLYAVWRSSESKQRLRVLNVYGCNGGVVSVATVVSPVKVLRFNHTGDCIITCDQSGRILFRASLGSDLSLIVVLMLL